MATANKPTSIFLTRGGILSRLAEIARKLRFKEGVEAKLDLDTVAEERKTLEKLLDAISSDAETKRLEQLEERLRQLQDSVDRRQGGVMRSSDLPIDGLEN